MRLPLTRSALSALFVSGTSLVALASCTLLVDTSGLASGAAATLTPEGGPATSDGGAETGGPRPDSGRCSGTQGPAMVDLGAYCIDATEVTVGDFTRFEGAAAQTVGAQPGCSNAPTQYFANDLPTLPVRNVSWCEASAYCAWAGKHLCGKIGGGTLARSAGPDPIVSEWVRACSNGGTTKYAYGDTMARSTCNIQGNGQMAEPVGTRPGCRTTAGVFDMIGNAWEWSNVCESPTSGSCAIYGGSYYDADPQCRMDDVHPRSFTNKNVGFRCCGDP